ncbi:MAG TPA: hypothetical protein VFY20_08540 [Gemmatimonadales bacterium]|nr:hypothetical protein [Gemmatimonadales bacterium]
MHTRHLVSLLVLASACSREPKAEPQPDSAAVAPSAGTELLEADIEGAEYQIQFVDMAVGPIRFTDRKWTDSATQSTVTLLQTLGGDLDGDGRGDGLAILAANFGGTGTFVSAVPVLNRDGKAMPGKGAPLGDRTRIQALSLNADTVVIEMIAAGPADPACCPSDTVTQRFHLVGDSLALLP